MAIFGRFFQNQSNRWLHKILCSSKTKIVRAFIFVVNDRYNVVLAISISLKVSYIKKWIIRENRKIRNLLQRRSFFQCHRVLNLSRSFVFKFLREISIFERISKTL